jgi:two-component system NtrC family sensor kinase
VSSGVIAKQRRPRVLVVDDEPILRRVIERGLRDRFDLVVAADGQQAIEALDGGAKVDIVLTDIRMPRLDGFGLHDAILQRDPQLAARTIFMSASTGEPAVVERVSSIGGRIITKPFSILELGDILVGYVTELLEPPADEEKAAAG